MNNTAKRVLIFDDNLEILTLCALILKKLNYEVQTRSRCENVIEDVTRFNPDLILMDLWIPEIGGQKAVELLKANPILCHIPVFLFSANPDIREICKKVNANGYIAKPFNLQVFKNTVESV